MHIAIRGTILTLILAPLLCTAGAQAADLTIRIDNVENNDGQLMVALYDSAAGYLKQPVRKTSVDAVAGNTTVVFKDLAPGDYAFSVLHDANGNGRMDTNRMGRPTEAVAFSKDAQGFMGPPSFEAARFTMPADGASVSASLR
jgi:uncharacterized protein (DUF2141 family)